MNVSPRPVAERARTSRRPSIAAFACIFCVGSAQPVFAQAPNAPERSAPQTLVDEARVLMNEQTGLRIAPVLGQETQGLAVQGHF